MSLLRSWFPSTHRTSADDFSNEQPLSKSIAHPPWVPPPHLSQSSPTLSNISNSWHPKTPMNTGPLASLRRQERELQSYLQVLLDAQAMGLNGGDPGQEHDSYAIHNASQILDLQSARKGLRETMLSICTIKRSEEVALSTFLEAHIGIISQITTWQAKQSGLKQQIDSINSEPSATQVKELQEENQTLRQDIHSLEAQLSEMKVRQHVVQRELFSLEDSVRAKLSSFQNSLALLNKEIKDYLSGSRLPVEVIPGAAGLKLEQSAWLLPPSRRTLGMILEESQSHNTAIRNEQSSVHAEVVALTDGTKLWSSAVREITAFEKRLQSALASISNAEHDLTSDAESLLEHAQKTIHSVTAKYNLAEERGWNLLIAALGAELDALAQGVDILHQTIEATSNISPSKADEDLSTSSTSPSRSTSWHRHSSFVPEKERSPLSLKLSDNIISTKQVAEEIEDPSSLLVATPAPDSEIEESGWPSLSTQQHKDMR